jgi:CubicO group peptidase (beta-lactamase class C family)
MLYPGRDFEKASCRDASLDKSLLVEMFDHIQEHKINIHQMVLLRDGAKIFDAYADSFGPQTREEVYSISKSFTSVAIGMLADKGRIDLDTPAIRYLNVPSTALAQGADRITVRHLLTMTTGHDRCRLFDEGVHANPVEMFFGFPLDTPPGTHFVYENHASFILSAIVTALTKQTVNDFLDERLYQKIGIVKPVWKQLGDISYGAFGLELGALDMARFGHFCLNEGSWKGDQIVSRNYMREALKFQVPTAHVDNPRDRFGYGYQFWINDFGDARAAGMFKQYIVIQREFGVVFAVQSYEEREVLDLFSRFILPAFFKGWSDSIHSLRDYIYRFTMESKPVVATEKQNRTVW